MITPISILHRTTYRYRRPVILEPHLLQLRPRESRDLRVLSFDVALSPPATITWANDVFGNTIATAHFSHATDLLLIESRVTLDHQAEAWPLFDIAASAISFPFQYSYDEKMDLGALLLPQHADPDGRLRSWATGFVRGSPTDTLSLLKDLNIAISAWISYEARNDEGTQAPLETLDRGFGSCRDLALLLIESARCLGFGARIVSGYLADRSGAAGSFDAGSTHAWAEIFLPGAGWVTFDPTHRTVGDFSLIPVAVARDIRQAVPVAGSFVGEIDDFLGMTVEVDVQIGASSDHQPSETINGRFQRGLAPRQPANA